MIGPRGREVRNLPVQNYRWHLLTRPSIQQLLLSPLLDAEYGSANFTVADGPAQYEGKVNGVYPLYLVLSLATRTLIPHSDNRQTDNRSHDGFRDNFRE